MCKAGYHDAATDAREVLTLALALTLTRNLALPLGTTICTAAADETLRFWKVRARVSSP